MQLCDRSGDAAGGSANRPDRSGILQHERPVTAQEAVQMELAAAMALNDAVAWMDVHGSDCFLLVKCSRCHECAEQCRAPLRDSRAAKLCASVPVEPV